MGKLKEPSDAEFDVPPGDLSVLLLHAEPSAPNWSDINRADPNQPNEAVAQAEAPKPTLLTPDESDTDSSSPTVVRYGLKSKSSGKPCPYDHPGQPRKI
eukprot:3082869-Karenia_brevis.AAC.1